MFDDLIIENGMFFKNYFLIIFTCSLFSPFLFFFFYFMIVFKILYEDGEWLKIEHYKYKLFLKKYLKYRK